MDDDADHVSDIEWEETETTKNQSHLTTSRNSAVAAAVQQCFETNSLPPIHTNLDILSDLRLASEKNASGFVLGIATVVVKEIQFQWNGVFTQRTEMETHPIRDEFEHGRFEENRNRLENYTADASFAKAVAFQAEVLHWLEKNRFPQRGSVLPLHRYVQRVMYDRTRVCKDAVCRRRNGISELIVSDRFGQLVCKKCGLVDDSEKEHFSAEKVEYDSDREREAETAACHIRKFKSTESFRHSLYLKRVEDRASKDEERHTLGEESFLALQRARCIGKVIVEWASRRDDRLNKKVVEDRLYKLFQSAYELMVANAKAVNRVRQLIVMCAIKSIRDSDCKECPVHTLDEFADRKFSYKNSSQAKVTFCLPPFAKLLKLYSSFLASIGEKSDLTQRLTEEHLHRMLHALGYAASGGQKENYFRVVEYWEKKAKLELSANETLRDVTSTRDPKVVAAAILFRALNHRTKMKHVWPEFVVRRLGAMLNELEAREIGDHFADFFADEALKSEPLSMTVSDDLLREYKKQWDRDGQKKVFFKISWLHLAFDIHKSRIWPIVYLLPEPGICTTGPSSSVSVQRKSTPPKKRVVRLFRRARTSEATAAASFQTHIKRSLSDLFPIANSIVPSQAPALRDAVPATVLQNIKR